VFHQRLTYTVTDLTVLETPAALNILHHFTFVVEQDDDDFAASKTAEMSECNQGTTRIRDQQCCSNKEENRISRSMRKVNYFR